MLQLLAKTHDFLLGICEASGVIHSISICFIIGCSVATATRYDGPLLAALQDAVVEKARDMSSQDCAVWQQCSRTCYWNTVYRYNAV